MQTLKSICVIILTLTLSCKTSEKKFAYSSITFGSGGGFTGKYQDYTLKPDGKLFKNVAGAEPVLLKTLAKKAAGNLFTKAIALKIESIDFNKPANMNKYIIVTTANGEHKINWGGVNAPNEQIAQLFDELMELAKCN